VALLRFIVSAVSASQPYELSSSSGAASIAASRRTMRIGALLPFTLVKFLSPCVALAGFFPVLRVPGFTHFEFD
jgi:hypothetical protein